MKRREKQSGFSLIEAMVTLVVLSVGMIGMAALYGQGLGAGRIALYRTVAVNLTADMADRIRLNRRAGAAYNGAPADNGCRPPATTVCTAAQLASDDLFSWNQALAQALPGGSGTVAFANGIPATYTITVTWQESGIGAVNNVVVVQVPPL
jgi:type IV pilus assembly protein PilV